MKEKSNSDTKFELLEVFENKNMDKRFVCEHIFSELTTLCPTTDAPDFYTIQFIYEPDRRIIELKSLKIYLSKYRNTRVFHEELINDILEDFIKKVNPKWILLELKANVRGGIATTVRRYWDKKNGENIEKAIRGM